MSVERGALPGTIRTASLKLLIDALAPHERGLATVSLDGLQFNEVEAPALFATMGVHIARQSDLRITPEASGDTIEEWPRRTVRRELTVEIENLSDAAIENREIAVLLVGYPAAPTPNPARYTRAAALPVPNTGDPVTAATHENIPLPCLWRAVPCCYRARQISGTETVLAVGAAKEVTIHHAGQAVFEDVQEPIITAPAGTRIICLRVGTNGDSTNGSQFVLLLERSGVYGTTNVTFDWTRRGVEVA